MANVLDYRSKDREFEPQICRLLFISSSCTFSDLWPHILKFYSLWPIQNFQIGERSPFKLKCYRGKCFFYFDPEKSPTPWSFGLKSFPIETLKYGCYVRISTKIHWKCLTKMSDAWFHFNIETPIYMFNAS